MKRLLSLILLYALCFTSLAPVLTQAQEQNASITELKEQIQKLLTIERDPSTPLDVKEMNHIFLEERRTQLRAVIQAKVNAFRKYQATVRGTLTARENQVIETSILDLEKDLQKLASDRQQASSSATSVSEALSRIVPPPLREAPDTGSASTSPRVSASGAASIMGKPLTGAAPPRTVLPPAPAMAADAPPAPDAAAAPTTATVCGEIVPASINETFAMIRSSLSDADYRDLKKAARVADYDAQGNTIWNALQSVFTDDCAVRTEGVAPPTTEAKVAELRESEAGRVQLRNRRKSAVIRFLETYLERTSKSTAKGGVRYEIRSQEERSRPEFPALTRDAIKKQILLLEQYTGNVSIHIVKDNGDIVRTIPADGDGAFPNDSTSSDGDFRITVPIPESDETKYYLVSTEGDAYHLRRKVVLKRGDVMKVDLELEDRPVSLLARAVVGYEQAAASSATREQSYFFDLYISKSVPFLQKIDPDFGERWRTWGNIRFNSVPQPGNTALGTFVSNFAQQAAGVQVKDVARVFDFQGGLEVRIAGNNSLLPNFDRITRQKFSLSLIASGGSITPLNSQETIATFRVFPGAPGLPTEAVGKEFVSFIASDRDRFFRQYFAGFRVQSFFFNRYNMPIQRFPAQLDLTVGQSEFVTGGRLRGPVIRVEGYYPLPFEDLKFINLYGTALLRPGRADIKLPLVLQPAPAATIVPASNVALVLAPQPNRDYYRAGMGIDFISFVAALKKLGNK